MTNRIDYSDISSLVGPSETSEYIVGCHQEGILSEERIISMPLPEGMSPLVEAICSVGNTVNGALIVGVCIPQTIASPIMF